MLANIRGKAQKPQFPLDVLVKKDKENKNHDVDSHDGGSNMQYHLSVLNDIHTGPDFVQWHASFLNCYRGILKKDDSTSSSSSTTTTRTAQEAYHRLRSELVPLLDVLSQLLKFSSSSSSSSSSSIKVRRCMEDLHQAMTRVMDLLVTLSPENPQAERVCGYTLLELGFVLVQDAFYEYSRLELTQRILNKIKQQWQVSPRRQPEQQQQQQQTKKEQQHDDDSSLVRFLQSMERYNTLLTKFNDTVIKNLGLEMVLEKCLQFKQDWNADKVRHAPQQNNDEKRAQDTNPPASMVPEKNDETNLLDSNSTGLSSEEKSSSSRENIEHKKKCLQGPGSSYTVPQSRSNPQPPQPQQLQQQQRRSDSTNLSGIASKNISSNPPRPSLHQQNRNNQQVPNGPRPEPKMSDIMSNPSSQPKPLTTGNKEGSVESVSSSQPQPQQQSRSTSSYSKANNTSSSAGAPQPRSESSSRGSQLRQSQRQPQPQRDPSQAPATLRQDDNDDNDTGQETLMYTAAMFAKPEEPLQFVQRPVPTMPDEGQVLIKVLACGVCRSDALTQTGDFPGITYPRVPGHEITGYVVRLGKHVTWPGPGTMVGMGWHGGHCLVCRNCRRGNFAICTNCIVTGIHLDGGYQEYVVAHWTSLLELPKKFNPVRDAPLLGASVVLFRGLQSAKPGDVVAIQGIGGIGHIGIQYARKMGYRVVAISSNPDKQEVAMRLGAHTFIDMNLQKTARKLQKLGGAKLIISTAPSAKVIEDLVPGLGLNGQLLVVGIDREKFGLSPNQLVFSHGQVLGITSGAPRDTEDACEFAILQGIECITEIYPLQKAQEAFDRMMSGEARFRVVLEMPK